VEQSGAAPSNAPVALGLYYTQVGTAGANSPIGNGEVYAQDVVNYIDSHGGFGGRQAKLYPYGVQVTNELGDNTTNDQAGCTQFTTDNHVQIALQITGLHTDTYYQCLAKSGVAMLNVESTSDPDQATMNKYPNLVYQTTPSSNAVGLTFANSLHRRGYFDGSGKIGVIYSSDPYMTSEKTAFVSQLAKYGIKAPMLADVIAVSPQGTGNSSSQLANTVVKFRSAGVSKVVLLGLNAFGFIAPAYQQGYTPSYAMVNIPTQLDQSSAPAAALSGALDIGYIPANEVNAAQEGTPNKAATTCINILNNAGHHPLSRIAELQARWTCESLFWVQAVANKAKQQGSSSLTPQTISKAVGALGNSPGIAAAEFGVAFGPNQHAGGSLYRDMQFSTSCSCFQYVGPLRPINEPPGKSG
jgi:hypothetical protein